MLRATSSLLVPGIWHKSEDGRLCRSESSLRICSHMVPTPARAEGVKSPPPGDPIHWGHQCRACICISAANLYREQHHCSPILLGFPTIWEGFLRAVLVMLVNPRGFLGTYILLPPKSTVPITTVILAITFSSSYCSAPNSVARNDIVAPPRPLRRAAVCKWTAEVWWS